MNTDLNIGPGMLLVSAPMMWDPNFRRTVILLCETGESGSFGLVLNRPIEIQSDEIQMLLRGQSPQLFLGGPVQPNTLHYVHNIPELVTSSAKLADGIYWGGEFESVQSAALDIDFMATAIRFFIGYSGWTDGQLEAELKNHDWIIAPSHRDFIFDTAPDQLWSRVVSSLGGDYSLFANFPENPRLN